MRAPPAVGHLLVATHGLDQPAFRRSAVLLLSHDHHGTVGVVLNRPTGMTPPGPLARWATLTATPPVLFRGGPISPDRVIGVASAESDASALAGWQTLVDPLGVLDLRGDVDAARACLTGVRMFAGYAGWSPGQLDGELEAGAWFVVRGEPGDVLTDEPDALWRTVLARQGGLFTTVPLEPELN